MTVAELIDELLNFELTDKVNNLNLQITVGAADWYLTKPNSGQFSKWTPTLGNDKAQNAANFAGIYTNTRKRHRGALP